MAAHAVAAVFDWAALVLAVLLVVAAWYVGRSWFSVAEFSALAISSFAAARDPGAAVRPGVASLLALKLTLSLAVSAARAMFNPRNRDMSRPTPPPTLAGTVGVAAANVEDIHLDVLPVSGRHHDWACLAAHTLSDDKFVSYALTSWGRWMSWCVLLIWVLLAVATGLDFALTGRAVNAVFSGVALLDVCNMRRDQLLAAARSKPWWRGALDLALTAGLCGFMVWPDRAPRWVHSLLPFEFPLLLVAAALLTAVLSCWVELARAAPNEHAREE